MAPGSRQAKAPRRERLKRLRSSARYGRLRARLPRYGFLALVAVMCAAGVRSTFLPPSVAERDPGSRTGVDLAAQSFALEFARSYLTYGGSETAGREAALAAFAPANLRLEAGFTPPARGSQRVEWADVAQVQRPLHGGSVVTVAAKLSTAAQPVYLSVPVAREPGGALRVNGYPAFVGPPLRTTRDGEPSVGRPVEDPEAAGLVERALTNYLAGDAENLSADLAAAATVTLPTSPLRVRGVERLHWVAGDGGGAVLATIAAVDRRGGAYTLAYEVGMRRVGSHDPRIGPGWRVTYVQTVSQES